MLPTKNVVATSTWVGLFIFSLLYVVPRFCGLQSVPHAVIAIRF